MSVSPRETQDCSWDGNPDLYGLGIRTSLYMQYATALVCAFAPENKRHRFKEANVIFGFAVFVELFRLGATKQALGPEVAIVFWLIAPSISLYGFQQKRVFGVVIILSMCIAVAQSYYWVWLWYKGLDLMRRPECEHAIVWFFYAKVELYNWYRTFLKVMSIILALSVTWNFLVYVFAGIGFLLGGASEAFDDDDDDEGVNYNQISGAIGAILSGGIIAIPATELTLNWNHVRGVHSLASASQLIPLLLAIGQLVYACAEALKPLSVRYSTVRQGDDIELNRLRAPAPESHTRLVLPEIPKVTSPRNSTTSVND